MTRDSIRQKLKLLREQYPFFKLFLESGNPDILKFLRELKLFSNDDKFKKIGFTEYELKSIGEVSAELAKIPKYRRYDRLWMILSSEIISFKVGNAKFSIEPLSHSTIKESVRLVKRILPNQGLENANIAFRASLAFEESGIGTFFYKSLLNSYGVNELHYWVVIYEESQLVVGTTGLYCYRKDAHEADWGGWMCVDPAYRRYGIFFRIGDFTLAKTRARGKKYLRLYTSTDPNEATANLWYDRKGFRIFKREQLKGTRFEMLYREKEL